MCTQHDLSFHGAVVDLEVQCPWKRALEAGKSKQFIYIALTRLIMVILPSESQDIDSHFLSLPGAYLRSLLTVVCIYGATAFVGFALVYRDDKRTPLAVLYLSDVRHLSRFEDVFEVFVSHKRTSVALFALLSAMLRLLTAPYGAVTHCSFITGLLLSHLSRRSRMCTARAR